MTLDDLLAHLKRVRRSGNGHVACCPSHDDRHPSLRISQIGNKILLHCFFGCSIAAICEALGIRISDLFVESSDADTRSFSDAERRDYARKLWSASKPARGTVVETYLRNRGITMPIPRGIQLTTVSCDDYPRPMRWPAMIAEIQDLNGEFTGITTTVLCADGRDKAPVETPKKIYGPFRGGAVRLSSQLDTQVAIGEGLETMLSVMQATGFPCWSALTASNLARVELPASVREVIICTDADETGEAAALRAVRRFMCEGRQVRIARTGKAGADFNDLRL